MNTLRTTALFLLLISPSLFSQWSTQTSPTVSYLNDVQFVGPQTGYVVVGGGQLLRTTNGGGQWSMQNFSSGLSISKLRFISTSVGWGIGSTAGKRGVILKTVDGGASWAVQDSSFQNVYPQSVFFVDPQHGWVASSASSPDTAGRIYRTVNGGATWVPVDLPNIARPNDIYFTDTLTGFAVGQYGGVVKSTDGGITWREVYRASYSANGTSSMTEPLRRVVFADKNNGWAVGGISGVETKIRTTDGGVTWQISNQTPGGSSLQGLCFTDTKNGWAVGGVVSGPVILRTTDGGVTWGRQTHPLASNTRLVFWSIHMYSADEGWVVGDSGKILKTTNGGGSIQVSGITDRDNDVPQAFSLSQNYPNPFNPTTVISYELPANSFVTLKIYDLLGREIATVVNEMGTPGVYTARWDGKSDRGESLSSGVYLYELRAGTSVMTRKMVLLR
ncbi:MAG: YCF48-related protein [Ignavibacteriales bacterium]|nr:YCF48-related protein [Ignavibacteriales bacterium]